MIFCRFSFHFEESILYVLFLEIIKLFYSSRKALEWIFGHNPISTCKNVQQKVDKSTRIFENLESQLTTDPNKILPTLLDILEKYSLTCTCRSNGETTSSYRATTSNEDQFIKDFNNNVEPKDGTLKRVLEAAAKKRPINRRSATGADNKRLKTASTARMSCDMKKSCSNIYKLRQQRLRGKNFEADGIKVRRQDTRFTETAECTCNDERRCVENFDCGYQCCTNCSTQSIAVCTSNSRNLQCGSRSMPFKNSIGDTGSSFQRNVNTVYITRTQNDANPYRHLEDSNELFGKKNVPLDDGKQLQYYNQQLDKCRELLKADCPANVTSNIPVNKIIDPSRIVGSLKPYYETDEPMKDILKTDSTCSLDCPNDCAESSSCTSDTFPLLITDGQGLVEIHILSLQLSTSAKQIFSQEESVCNVLLFVSWDIWDQETACTPTLRCPKLNFNSSFVYRISDLFSFFNCVLSKYVIFNVNAIQENNNNYVVARAKLCIKDILDYPQNKLHYIAPVNSVIPCTRGLNLGQLSLWVRLSCNIEKVEAFKKQCGLHSQMEHEDDTSPTEQKKMSNAIDLVPSPAVPSVHELMVLKEQDPSESFIYETSKDQITSFNQESSLPHPLSETSQEINNTVKQSVLGENTLPEAKETEEKVEKRELYVEAPISTLKNQSSSILINNEDETSDEGPNKARARLGLNPVNKETSKEEETQAETSSIVEFNAFLATTKDESVTSPDSKSTICDMNDVLSDKNWEKFKQRSLLGFTNRIRSNYEDGEQNNENDPMLNRPIEKETIIIEIANIMLFQKSEVMHDDEVKMLYVEYSFLGYYGADMETVSVEKPKTSNQKMKYNFRKTFRIDKETHGVERNTLRAMLKEIINPNIRFVLVSEPLPEETNIKECIEVGIADFNIREYALGNSQSVVPLPIMTLDHTAQIGVLKIFVLGLDAIRQCLGD